MNIIKWITEHLMEVFVIIAVSGLLLTLAIIGIRSAMDYDPMAKTLLNEKSINACISNKGVPILDAFGRLTDCKFN